MNAIICKGLKFDGLFRRFDVKSTMRLIHLARSSDRAVFFLAKKWNWRYNKQEVIAVAYDFVQNKDCPYFPCHAGADPEKFSCLFCYCPLYALGDRCGGGFTYTAEGVKDCSRCMKPHDRNCYGEICEKLKQVMEMVKKQP